MKRRGNFVFLAAGLLCLTVGQAGAATSGFVIAQGPGKLVDSLIAAGYGNEQLYHALLDLQIDSNPSLSGVITPAFLNALASCPANSTIFTTRLSAYAGNGVAIYPDCTATATYVQGSGFNGLPGNTTLATAVTGVSATAAVVSLGTPVAMDSTHTAFAILYAPQGTSKSFVLSNEAPGQLISKLIAAGYGNLDLYDTLLTIQQNTNPTISLVLVDSFLASLHNCPAISPVFTIQLKNVSSTQAISDDCSVQNRNLTGSSFAGHAGTTTLVTSISGAGSASLVSSTSSSPVTSWTQNIPVGSGTATVTYNAFGILYTPGTEPPPATPAPPTLWLAAIGCLALGGWALRSRRLAA